MYPALNQLPVHAQHVANYSVPLSLSLSLALLSLSWPCLLSDLVDLRSLSLSSFFFPSVLGCFFSSGGGVFSSFQRGKACRRSFHISPVLPHLRERTVTISEVHYYRKFFVSEICFVKSVFTDCIKKEKQIMLVFFLP